MNVPMKLAAFDAAEVMGVAPGERNVTEIVAVPARCSVLRKPTNCTETLDPAVPLRGCHVPLQFPSPTCTRFTWDSPGAMDATPPRAAVIGVPQLSTIRTETVVGCNKATLAEA